MPNPPTLTLSLSINGDLVAHTPAGLTLRLDPDTAYHQLSDLLMRQPRGGKVGGWASPTQWDLDEPTRKARIWAQFNQRPVGEYFDNNPAVLAPGDEAKVTKYTPRGKPKVDLEGLLQGQDLDTLLAETCHAE